MCANRSLLCVYRSVLCVNSFLLCVNTSLLCVNTSLLRISPPLLFSIVHIAAGRLLKFSFISLICVVNRLSCE